MTKETSRLISPRSGVTRSGVTRSGVTRNGRVWYQLNGKFCSKRAYDMAKALDSSKVPAKKVTTQWDGDINPTLLLIVAVIVLVFVVILGCIMVGNAKLDYYGVYKPWKWNANELRFVEDTCRDTQVTTKE